MTSLRVVKASLGSWLPPDFSDAAKAAYVSHLEDMRMQDTDEAKVESEIILKFLNYYPRLFAKLHDKLRELKVDNLLDLEKEVAKLASSQPLMLNETDLPRSSSLIYYLYYKPACKLLQMTHNTRVIVKCIRRMCEQQICYSIPSRDVLRYILKVSGDKILQLNAGTGYWAAKLKMSGVQVIALSKESAENKVGDTRKPVFHDLVITDVAEYCKTNQSSLSKYTLFVCYPQDDDLEMYQKCLQSYKGSTVCCIADTKDERIPKMLKAIPSVTWQEDESFELAATETSMCDWSDASTSLRVFKRKVKQVTAAISFVSILKRDA